MGCSNNHHTAIRQNGLSVSATAVAPKMLNLNKILKAFRTCVINFRLLNNKILFNLRHLCLPFRNLFLLHVEKGCSQLWYSGRLLLTPQDPGSNPLIGNLNEHLFTDYRREKRKQNKSSRLGRSRVPFVLPISSKLSKTIIGKPQHRSITKQCTQRSQYTQQRGNVVQGRLWQISGCS